MLSRNGLNLSLKTGLVIMENFMCFEKPERASSRSALRALSVLACRLRIDTGSVEAVGSRDPRPSPLRPVMACARRSLRKRVPIGRVPRGAKSVSPTAFKTRSSNTRPEGRASTHARRFSAFMRKATNVVCRNGDRPNPRNKNSDPTRPATINRPKYIRMAIYMAQRADVDDVIPVSGGKP